ncbi:MAG: enoyl-CoA hydratase-related protein [Halobacteriota archaeon]|nr:enoyl-CoA hydratase-related protein [Halobacteriota archaeon]
MDFETIIFEKEDEVGTITLNRPKSLNAINYKMICEYVNAMEMIRDDDGIRAVIVTGAGKGFCSGADLTSPDMPFNVMQPSGMREYVQSHLQRMGTSMLELEIPIVGAINGMAAGAGCNLALSSDIIIASDEARFSQIFAKRALVPDVGGMFMLPRLVGMAKAKELMFTADNIDAEEAFRIGMINRVVPAGDLMKEAREFALRLANGPTKAIGMTKRILNKAFESDLRTILDHEASAQGIAVSTKDAREGVSSFLQKREPRFKGR